MSDDIDNDFNALVETYNKSLPDKVAKIEEKFNQLCTNWNSQNVVDLASLVHNLSGSAGIYGHDEISKIASKIEANVNQFDNNTPASPVARDQIAEQILILKKISTELKTKSIAEVQKVNINLVY